MLTAHEYPIIEFDDNKTAKLNPTHFAGNVFSTNKLVIAFFSRSDRKVERRRKNISRKNHKRRESNSNVSVCKF